MSKAALYLSTCIARSSKSQKQIALETGYPQPNILSMFKKGQTKIPVNAVIPLADAIGGDRLFLMRLVLEDHFPDCHEDLQNLIARGEPLTRNECAMLRTVRQTMKAMDIDMGDPEIVRELEQAMQRIARIQERSERGARDHYDMLPRNGKHRID